MYTWVISVSHSCHGKCATCSIELFLTKVPSDAPVLVLWSLPHLCSNELVNQAYTESEIRLPHWSKNRFTAGCISAQVTVIPTVFSRTSLDDWMKLFLIWMEVIALDFKLLDAKNPETGLAQSRNPISISWANQWIKESDTSFWNTKLLPLNVPCNTRLLGV